jgi:crossover junction endodeoxyribonuclease RuvC
MIEKVHSMPKQGVASSFKFGRGYGGLRMALIAAGIPFEEVTPQAWQKALAIPKRSKTETPVQWKNRLKALAQQLYPDIKVTLKLADALLIATYCQRKHTGTL